MQLTDEDLFYEYMRIVDWNVKYCREKDNSL